MSPTPTLRRVGAALLATGLAGGLALTATPAQAASSQVCIGWTSSGHGYIDKDGNDIYVIEARCNSWLTTGGDVIDEPEKDHDDVPKGASPGGDDSKEAHCAFLKDLLADQRTALAWATAGHQAAEDEVERLTYKSGSDYAAYVAAHEAYLRAVAALAEATTHYQEETDTELERETRNGNTVVVQRAIDPNRPWGEVVIAAQEQLDRVRAEERAAWAAWASGSAPAARAAQALLDSMDQVLATAPMNIEGLLRDLGKDC
jgi:hypothetical protein